MANVLCVTRNDQFKGTAQRINMNEEQLEGILHEYFNADTTTDKETYPSDEYILSQVQGKPFFGSAEQVELWNTQYSQPINIATREELEAVKTDLQRFFPAEGIGVKQNQDGSFEVSVKEPTEKTEDSDIFDEGERTSIQDIQDQRLKDMYGKETTMTDLLNLFGDDSKYSGIVNLLKSKSSVFSSLLNDVQVRLYEPGTSKDLKQGRAYYNAGEKNIYINAFANYAEGNAESVILHEVLHAATLERLKGNRALRNRFNNIIKEYNRHFHNERYNPNSLNKKVAEHYLEEFVADVWSNPVTIENLKSIKTTGNKTLWDKIKEFFTRLFAGSEGTLMEDASNALNDLLDSPVSGYAEGLYFEGGQVIYRGYATQTEQEATDLDDTVAGTAADYVENVPGFKAKYHFTSSREEAEEYAKNRTDKSEEEFYRDGKLVKQQNRHYTGDFAHVGEYVISDKAKIAEFEDLHDLNLHPEKASGVDVIILKKGTLDQSASEFIVREGAKDLVQSIKQQRRQVLESIRPSLQKDFIEATKKSKQIDAMLSSDVITPTDISDTALIVSNWISDMVTLYQTNPEKLFENFDALERKNNWATEEDKKADLDAVSKLSRKEIVEKIGINNFLERAKLEIFFSPAIKDTKDRRQARFFAANFDGLFTYISPLVSTAEDFVLKSVDEEGFESKVATVNDEVFGEESEPIDKESLDEVTRDMTEHWAVESRTLDTWKTATQEVRNALTQCYLLGEDKDENGVTKTDEQGNKLYRPVRNKFAQKEHIKTLQATQQILHWVQGSLNSNDMVAKLEAKAEANPWVTQIIARLKDTSGKEADFRSQFFKTFYKPWTSYFVQLKNKKTNKVHTAPVNVTPALNQVVNEIKVSHNIGTHPLFTSTGINLTAFEKLSKYADNFKKGKDAKTFGKVTEDIANKEKLATAFANVSAILGYPVAVENVMLLLNESNFNSMTDAVVNIKNTLERNLNNNEYNPFKYGKDSINGYLKSFLSPIAESLEEIEKGSFYANGKMYQGYVTPSYTTKMMDKLTGNQEVFQQFITEEFANTEWFVEEVGLPFETLKTRASVWRNLTLQKLVSLSEEERRRFTGHKVVLNYQGNREYMRNMSSSEYAMSVLTEFASEQGKSGEETIPAWYIFPMESNKPSEEFFKSFRFVGDTYKDTILRGMRMMFNQEISRIQTVMMRNLKKGDPGFIENFDDRNGKKFNFLPWMNKYLEGGELANSEAGKELQRKLRGDAKDINDNPINEQVIKDAVDAETRAYLEKRVEGTIQQFKDRGIYDNIKTIENTGNNEEEINKFIENFVWNHIYAENSFLQMTVTDLAYYKNSEDLQKRLAQLHSPGLVGDRAATDYNGNSVTDGKFRIIYLNDLEGGKGVAANVVDNLRAYFEQKIEQLPEVQREPYRAFAENFMSNYDNFTITDGQAFSTLTGLRKKSFVFGNWSRQMENIWEKFRDGKTNVSDINTVSQVKKPFTYSQINKSSGVEGSPIQTLKFGVQHKDSEALLIMAYGIIGDTDTGRPNILRALMKVMEETHFTKDDNGEWVVNDNGIDTAVFHSGVKTGYMTGIDLNDLLEDPNGEAKAIERLRAAIGSSVHGYNPLYVHEIAVEDAAQQLEVPGHFRDHENIWGSQERFIIPSAVEGTFMGEEVRYEVSDNKETRELTAKEYQHEYEETASQNIEDSLDSLAEELGLNEYYTSKADRNVALMKILQKEITSSPRYGSDLLLACTVDENTGEFRIPLGDSIQSKRIEQLINSIVKNRVNKQKFKGGPSVLVTNWGRTKRLNVIFRGKDGNVLPVRSEWEKANPNGNYDEFLKENQNGVAWYECYASATTVELLKNFIDEDGFIDTEAIEMIDGGEELLKMIGYRIPTEDMYSIAPFKIVGFLPKEMGDAFMQPWEMPAITGEDHDVDKKNLLRKQIYLARKFNSSDKKFTNLSDVEAAKVWTVDHKKELIDYLVKTVSELDALLETPENKAVIEKLQASLSAEQSLAEERIEYNRDKADAEISSKWADRELSKLRKEYDKKRNRVPQKAKAVIVKQFLDGDVFQPAKNSLEKALKKAYMNYMFQVIEPGVKVEDGNVVAFGDTREEKRDSRNNHIFNMTWSLLTSKASVEKILNTGSFEPQKNLGYKVTAYKNHPEMSWEEIDKMTTDEVKSLAFSNKYLPDFTTQMEYYENNSVAGNVLGQAAIQRIAHAILKGGNYGITLPQNYEFTLAGQKFSGFVPIDIEFAYTPVKVDVTDNSIDASRQMQEPVGKTLGNHVGAAADAVKDPVLNLLNINTATFRTYATMLRLGVPFRVAGLMLSSQAMTDVIAEQRKRSLTRSTPLSKVIEETLNKIEKQYALSKESSIKTEELTFDELVTGLRPSGDEVTDAKIAYKILTHWRDFEAMTLASQPLTIATRYNSVASAVGPQVIDNKIQEHKANLANARESDYKLMKLGEDGHATYEVGTQDVLAEHPILNSFAKSYDIAADLLRDMPAQSESFDGVLKSIPKSLQTTFFNDRGLMLSLSDFYQSYLLVKNSVVNPANLDYFVNVFPKEFLTRGYKEKYAGNPFIDAIKPDTRGNKEGVESLVLNINTSGMPQAEIDRIKLGWAQFDKVEPTMSRMLFEYNFAIAGIGYSPKSFMNCVPLQVKESIPGYIDTYRRFPELDFADQRRIVEQFILNNTSEGKLVPYIRSISEKVEVKKDGLKTFTTERADADYTGLAYFRTPGEDGEVIYKLVNTDSQFGVDVAWTYEQVLPLGDNGAYYEISTSDIKKPLRISTTFEESSPRGEEEGLRDATEAPLEEKMNDAVQEKKIQELRAILQTPQGESVVKESLFTNIREGKIAANEADGIAKALAERLRRNGVEADENTIKEIKDRLC